MVMHVVSASAWIGGLVPLGWLVRAAQPHRYSTTDAQVVLLRFSHLGMLAVSVIAVTEAVNTWRMLGMAPDPLDAYGRVLLAKIVLFGFMLVLAAINRYWLMPQLVGPGRPLRALVRTILLEQGGLCGMNLDADRAVQAEPGPPPPYPSPAAQVTNWPAYDASLRQRGSAGCNHKALYATQLLSTSQPIRAATLT